MNTIAFIDTEIDPNSRKVLDIGCIRSDGNMYHKSSLAEFAQFLNDTEYICGHNILNHDLKYIGQTLRQSSPQLLGAIDTLYLSPLIFPTKPYHALLKDDKLQTEEMNNPLNDSIKARDLFYDEVSAFMRTDETLKQIFYLLLWDKREFRSFFRFIGYKCENQHAETLIRRLFANEICEHADVATMIEQQPVELAYCLSLIHSFIHFKKIHSITPPWVLKNYPEVERLMFRLRNKPCISGCAYCNNALDIHKGLKRFFGFDSYRTYGDEPLQEKAVKAAVDNKSLLAIFPTGGGKSITFQVPALMSGESANGLTIVISPLQSLMKDQVDNLERNGITEAVTINGLLDPIERAKSFERVEDGSASMLYISPESLRSKSIERLILGRKIVRFVIDEAHCFSSWGQDFRVDYLYIGDFIKQIQEKKNLEDGIPVSCFTATAKQKVIEDILRYFKEKLSIDLEVYSSNATRTNLKYKVFEKNDEEEKYQTVRDLIEEKNCPTIIYVSRTRKAYTLAERLVKDGFSARPYHGKMDAQDKTANQNAFIEGEVQIMVATSAFGMGVDKKDVGMVIHYEISDSLENYIQEAGRAGRDEKIVADCFVLFNEEDLSKHFILLNQTKLSIREVQQIWKAIKDLTRSKLSMSDSALEIARKAGWDDNVAEIETRVKTAIAALEDAGYIKRGQNMPRVFANSILSKNAQEAIDKINNSEKFQERQKEKGVRIIKKLLANKSRKQNPNDDAEARVDYISDDLGIVREEVINIITLLRQENILADAKDLTAYIKRSEQINRSLSIVDSYSKIEKFLLPKIEEQENTFHLKALNEEAEAEGCNDINIQKIKTILNFWSVKNWIKRQNLEYTKNHIVAVALHPLDILSDKLEKRRELGRFIVEYLFNKSTSQSDDNDLTKEQILVEFSVLELKLAYESGLSLFKLNIDLDDVEDALFYLSRIEAIKIEGGFLVTYNRLTIDRLEQDNRKKYTKENYEKLNQFYENKVQQIHIVGEYAKKMIEDYRSALQFVDDYFQLNYGSFLNRYFPGSKADMLKLKMTPAKFRQLFGELSPTQLSIINDNESRYIAVAAGPGSGKTRVLVHKLASLLLMEDVKHEQLLMLTFSRAAVTEFKKRLYKLIGNAAYFIEIKTFHSFCFDLLGKVGSLEKSDDILKKTIEKIRNNEVEISHITKSVLVIDEAQDMNEDEYHLINALMELNEEMRVIAVGDDDQNIYEFRGSSSKYLENFIINNNATKHELLENYRSKSNLVEYTNEFSKHIKHRLKSTDIFARQRDNGELKVVRYYTNNLIIPMVNDILSTGLSGTSCVLTKTNEEALQVAGLLLKNKVQAKLIQSNDGFSLYHIQEIRYLINLLNLNDDLFVISDDVWAAAKKEIATHFRSSNRLDLCFNLIESFEQTNPKKKYKSDFDTFVRESKLEDFYNENGETVFVSTIHKAKGKEFDNVFIMLDNYNAESDEANRVLYVGMTRAKRNLTIHLNSFLLDAPSNVAVNRIENKDTYLAPNGISLHLLHKDVNLGYFEYVQNRIENIVSGDTLIIKEEGCAKSNGDLVLKFSQKASDTLKYHAEKGYLLKEAKVNFILYWHKEGSDHEIKIILPELYLEKNWSFVSVQIYIG